MAAMLALYNSLNGDKWYNKWDLTVDPCKHAYNHVKSWYGVTCVIMKNGAYIQ